VLLVIRGKRKVLHWFSKCCINLFFLEMGHNLVKVGHEIGSNIELSNDEDEDEDEDEDVVVEVDVVVVVVVVVVVDDDDDDEIEFDVGAGMKIIFSLFNS
jgi:hypothetical protein